jgi:hypothetical protein
MMVLAILGLACSFHAEPVVPPQVPGILGSWHGTSTCVDKASFPACRDEEVIYDVTATHGDSVTIRADKVVNGVRDFMGEMALARTSDTTWAGEITTSRYRLRIEMMLRGANLTGRLMDVGAGRQVRAMALQRIAPSK